MKIIFLDFDGVLNYERYVRAHGNEGLIIAPECMENLKRIVDATKAKAVLSTSWREHWFEDCDKCDDIGRQINRLFAEYGIRIVGKTSEQRMPREQQIKLWLESHNDVEGFVVIDDLILEGEMLDGHFVKTYNGRKGLDSDSVWQAIDILEGIV